jgi:hypothetical protein
LERAIPTDGRKSRDLTNLAPVTAKADTPKIRVSVPTGLAETDGGESVGTGVPVSGMDRVALSRGVGDSLAGSVFGEVAMGDCGSVRDGVWDSGGVRVIVCSGVRVAVCFGDAVAVSGDV